MTPIAHPLRAAWRPRVPHAVREWLHAARQRREVDATRRALAALDDRTLRDLGLHRSEVGSAAHELVAAERTRLLRWVR